MHEDIITIQLESWAMDLAGALSLADGGEWHAFYLATDELILRSSVGEDLQLIWPVPLRHLDARAYIRGYFDELDPRHPLRSDCPMLEADMSSPANETATLIVEHLLPRYRQLFAQNRHGERARSRP